VAQQPDRRPRDAGFTLTELVVVIGMTGVLMAITVFGYVGWTRASAQDGAASTLQGVLRQAQQRAVSDGWATCVLFDENAGSWTLYRGACGATVSTLEGPREVADGVRITEATFAATTGAPTTGVTFSARGTATPGRVRLGREGSDRIVTVTVEGLTGRVTTS
jgi:type II secretion system protein H